MTVKDLRIKLQGLIADIADQELMNSLGKEIVDTVKSRTTKGYGVANENGPQTRLKGLSESYKKQRKRLKSQGQLSGKTTPNTSNLTKSGALVNSIDYKVSGNTVTVEPKDPENKKKAKYQADQGRIAFNLSKSERKKLNKIIEDKIKKDINKKGL